MYIVFPYIIQDIFFNFCVNFFITPWLGVRCFKLLIEVWNKILNCLNLGIWSTLGCRSDGIFTSNNQRFVRCKCDHLTNFAILLDVDQSSSSPLDLKIVSFVGCLISVAALSFTIIVHLAIRYYFHTNTLLFGARL